MKSPTVHQERTRGFRMSGMKKTVVCMAMLLPFGLLSGCDGGGGNDTEPAGYDANKVTVHSTNTRMTSSGILESQYADSPKGNGIAYIVDGNTSTFFKTPHNSCYILWSGDATSIINYYSVTSASNSPENDPKSWSLYGSNDGTTWTLLDSRTDQTFRTRKLKKEYDFNSKALYKYAKLDIESNNGGTAIQIAEFSMKQVQMDIDDLMNKSSGPSYSDITPMGKHYANKHVATAAELEWLSTASNEPKASQSSRSDASWKEFQVTLYPTAGGPSPADCNQRGIGDCCAIAVFGSFAYIYPEFIKDIIKDNGDRTFTVKMFTPQGNEIDVSVTSKFIADGGGTIQAVTGKNGVACWSTILEKAMMKWEYIYKVNENIGGIGTEVVAPLFTGDGGSFAFDRGKLGNADLARAVTVCLKIGKFVIGGWNNGFPVDNSETVGAHAYTFMHPYDSSHLFVMRNPWGGNPKVDGTKDGTLRIPDNNVIPPIIDLRICEPGKAARYGTGIKDPYTLPYFAPGAAVMQVSPELMISGR